jgi:hypothetical protein
MATPTHTYGTVLQVDATGGGTYADVAEVIDIMGPKVTVSSVKTTHLTSANAFHEKIPGLGDAGQLTFNLRFHKTQFNTLYGYLRSTKDWRVKLPLIDSEATNSRWDADGFIVEIGTEMPEDDKIIAPVTIELTGKPTFTAGA